MKMVFKELGIQDRLITFSNGKDIVDYIDNALSEVIKNAQTSSQRPIWPVSLVLLDINMPTQNGIQTLKIIKQKFSQINDYLLNLW